MPSKRLAHMFVALLLSITWPVHGRAQAVQVPYDAPTLPAAAAIDYVVDEHLERVFESPVVVVDPRRLVAGSRVLGDRWSEHHLAQFAGGRRVAELEELTECPQPRKPQLCIIRGADGVVQSR